MPNFPLWCLSFSFLASLLRETVSGCEKPWCIELAGGSIMVCWNLYENWTAQGKLILQVAYSFMLLSVTASYCENICRVSGFPKSESAIRQAHTKLKSYSCGILVRFGYWVRDPRPAALERKCNSGGRAKDGIMENNEWSHRNPRNDSSEQSRAQKEVKRQPLISVSRETIKRKGNIQKKSLPFCDKACLKQKCQRLCFLKPLVPLAFISIHVKWMGVVVVFSLPFPPLL